MAGGKTFLEDIKHSGTLEEKMICLKAILEGMVLKMREGFQDGCTDPKKIRIIDGRPYLPEKKHMVGKYPDYLVSFKDLAIYLHDNDHMTPRDITKFDSFTTHAGWLRTM